MTETENMQPKDVAKNQMDIARENLRLALAIKNQKAAAVSRAAGMSVNALANFLNGKVSISYQNILAVCEALAIPIGILHHPHSITPARLALHQELVGMDPRDLAKLARELESDPA